jgi:hypothetical protein
MNSEAIQSTLAGTIDCPTEAIGRVCATFTDGLVIGVRRAREARAA